MKLLPVLCAFAFVATALPQTAPPPPKTAAKKPAAAAKEPEPPPIPRPDGLYATIYTVPGKMVIKFFEAEAPLTVANWVGLARGGKTWTDYKTKRKVTRPMYPGTIFHRVWPGFMIQGGDPTGTGTGLCDRIPDEYSNGLKFDVAGRVAMANSGEPNSAGCQFFITETPQPHLDGKFTIFGQLIEGDDVVKLIGLMPRDPDNNRPNEPVKIDKITVERWQDGKPAPWRNPPRSQRLRRRP